MMMGKRGESDEDGGDGAAAAREEEVGDDDDDIMVTSSLVGLLEGDWCGWVGMEGASSTRCMCARAGGTARVGPSWSSRRRPPRGQYWWVFLDMYGGNARDRPPPYHPSLLPTDAALVLVVNLHPNLNLVCCVSVSLSGGLGVVLQCKHLLAIRLAPWLDKVTTYTVPDKEFCSYAGLKTS